MNNINLIRFIQIFIAATVGRFSKLSTKERLNSIFKWLAAKRNSLFPKRTAQVINSMVFICISDKTIRYYRGIYILGKLLNIVENRVASFVDDYIYPINELIKLIKILRVIIEFLNTNYLCSVLTIILFVLIIIVLHRVEKLHFKLTDAKDELEKRNIQTKLNYTLNILKFSLRLAVYLFLFSAFYKQELLSLGIGMTIGYCYFIYTLVEVSNKVAQKVVEYMNKKVKKYLEENPLEKSEQKISNCDICLLLIILILYAISIYCFLHLFFICSFVTLFIARFFSQLRKVLLRSK